MSTLRQIGLGAGIAIYGLLLSLAAGVDVAFAQGTGEYTCPSTPPCVGTCPPAIPVCRKDDALNYCVCATQ